MERQIELTLLENGLDFIWSAVEHLGTSSSKRSLKYAVLNLAAGIELILKERLRRKNWRLLFAREKEVNEHRYRRGAFRSVGLEGAIERLKSECNLEFQAAEQKRLKAVRDKRNRIQHFNMVDSASAIISTTARALEVVVDFIGQELGDSKITDSEKELLKDVRTKLGQLAEFVSVREKSINPALKKAYAVLPCPSCQQDALTVDDGVACLFCGYKTDGNEAACDYATDVLGITSRDVRKGAEWPVGICPGCDWDACVETGTYESEGYLCFHCGGRWRAAEIEECARCGRWIEDKNSCGVCDACMENELAKD